MNIKTALALSGLLVGTLSYSQTTQKDSIVAQQEELLFRQLTDTLGQDMHFTALGQRQKENVQTYRNRDNGSGKNYQTNTLHYDYFVNGTDELFKQELFKDSNNDGRSDSTVIRFPLLNIEYHILDTNQDGKNDELLNVVDGIVMERLYFKQ
jgi:hypothetical protein